MFRKIAIVALAAVLIPTAACGSNNRKDSGSSSAGSGSGSDANADKPDDLGDDDLPQVDACTVVTIDDAEPLVPNAEQDGRYDVDPILNIRGQGCKYRDGTDTNVDVLINVVVGQEAVDADYMKTQSAKYNEPTDEVKPLSDLGDAAYVVSWEKNGELSGQVWVLVGKRPMTLSYVGKDANFKESETIALARKAVQRLPRT
jgi:hypothetical protein